MKVQVILTEEHVEALRELLKKVTARDSFQILMPNAEDRICIIGVYNTLLRGGDRIKEYN